jgi:hypothetical protein
MPDPARPSAGKVIVFQFRGGARDGEVVRSDQTQEGVNEADTFWALTWKGTVGRRFNVSARNDPSAHHRYQVMSKSEASGEIQVTCEHVG